MAETETENVDLTIQDFNRLALGENEGITTSWNPGSILMVETRRIYNYTLGTPVITFPVDGEAGLKHLDINFINNTTFRVEYYEVGGLGVHGIGNEFTFYLINNVTNERVTITSVGLGDGDRPLGNVFLGKSLFFSIMDSSILTGDTPYPCFGVVSNASLEYPQWGQTNTWYDFWHTKWSSVPDWFLSDNHAQYPEYDKPSTEGGGDGSYTLTDEEILPGDVPSIDLLSFKLYHIYNPNQTDMEHIADWLWSPDFTDNITKNLAHPFDNIISFGYIPNFPSGDELSVTPNFPFGIGRVPAIPVIEGTATPILTNKVNEQFYEILMGELTIEEIWGSFLDYKSSYMIYLPFVGYQMLKINDFMGGTIGVKYNIDVVTGMTVVQVYCRKYEAIHTLYNFTTNILSKIQISGVDFNNSYNQFNRMCESSLTSMVGGTSVFPYLLEDYPDKRRNVDGNQRVSLQGMRADRGLFDMGANIANMMLQSNTLEGEKKRSGLCSTMAGSMSIRYPFIARTTPIPQVPSLYKSLNGMPSMITKTLSQVKGFTKVSEVLDDKLPSCTYEEKTAIIAQLKKGVVL